MKNYISFFSVLIILLINFGCQSADKKKVAVLTIKKGIFEITINGFGELNAVKATQIKVPTKARGSQIIVWLASENSIVKKGDVLIRFDGTNYRERIKTENYNLAKLDLELKKQEIELKKEKSNLEGELKIIAIENKIAKNYGAKDESVFSKNEIIDAEVNLKFLNTKMTHLKDKTLKFKKKAEAELQLLRLKKKTILVKLQQYKDTLDALEVKAPHNGLFVYQKNWRGEKPRVGSRVWTGMKLGKLPDLSIMEAKIFILESEASGLKSNLVCSIVLDSHPQKTFMGKVKGVDAIAKAIEKDSAFKYFETRVSLDKTDSEIMKPGNQVKALIFVHRYTDVIAVPNQAIFYNNKNSYVFVKNKKGFEPRNIKTGIRSLSRTIIDDGLSVDEQISLGNPDQEDK